MRLYKPNFYITHPILCEKEDIPGFFLLKNYIFIKKKIRRNYSFKSKYKRNIFKRNF